MDQSTLTSKQSEQQQLFQNAGLGELLSSSFAYNHNYAYIVTVILSQVGMNRSQNNIEDTGALQQEISKGQTQFASMQQFMALLEGNTQWDSNKKEAYWPSGFTTNNQDQLNNFVNAFGQFFWNSGSSKDDTSTTTTDLNIDFTTTKAVGNYPPGTKIIINPCADAVSVQPPGALNPTVLAGGGPFAQVLDNVRGYIENVSKYVTGSTFSFPSSGSTVPQYLAAAMANLQTSVDASPEGFQTEAFQAPNSSDQDPVAGFGGAIDANPLLTNAESLYSNFNDTTGVNGKAITTNIQSVYTGASGATASLWNDMGGMMADWMQNKMANQSSSSGSGAPSGSIYIQGDGLPHTYPGSTSSITSQLDYILNHTVGWAWWPEASGKIKDAISDLENNNFSGALSDLGDAKSYFNMALGTLCNKKVYGILCDQITATQTYQQAYNNYFSQFHDISTPGLFNEAQSSVSMAASTYQSQTQQNAAQVQQETSTLTSYDQIGQSIITAVNKSEETIAGNLKSS